MSFPRASGILLHPSSLPSRGGIGDFGPAAYAFADFLASARQGLWQVLPLGPLGFGNSPYSSTSAFAGNHDRRASVFETRDEAQNVLNAGGIADDAVDGGLGFGTLAEVEIFFNEADFICHTPKEQAQFVEGSKGLRNVIVSAELHRLDGGFHRSVAGHHGDFDAGVGAFDLLQKLDSGHARHDHVGKHHVRGLLFEQG